MTTGPEDLTAAEDRSRLRAADTDREQVTGALQAAFTQGRLTEDELDARADQALAAGTYADLAALTADIPGAARLAGPPASPAPAVAGLARPPAPARRWPLASAAARAGSCLTIAAAAVWGAALADPNPGGPNGVSPYHSWAPLCLLLALVAVCAALGFLGHGVVTSIKQRRSRRKLPPRPGPGGHALDGERRGGTGHSPGPPSLRTDQTRADLRAHKSREHRQHVPARAPRGVRPAPGPA